MTISWDIDDSLLEKYLLVKDYFFSDKMTKYEPGLNLKCGIGLWFFSNEKDSNHALIYLNPDEKKILDADYKNGLVDTLHAFGNLNSCSNPQKYFSRTKAVEYLNLLKKNNIKLDVWVNHGSDDNVQNLSTFSSGEGDLPNSKFYHFDLLKQYGIKFIWNGITPIIGQERKAFTYEVLNLKKNKLNIIDFVKAVASKSVKVLKKQKTTILFEPNDLIYPYKFRDGNKLYAFDRYGRCDLATLDTIPHILNENQINKLILNRGCSIIYSHLGRFNGKEINPKVIESFKLLKKYSEKYIWNCNVSELLNYIRIYKYLKYHYVVNDTRIVIFIQIDEPIKDIPVTPKDLKNITFFTPNPENTFIVFNGDLLKTKINVIDDEVKQYSITVI